MEVLILQRSPSGATPPKAKEAKPAKSDQERMVGDWVIMNADSKFKTDMTWTITKDRIHRHSNIGGWQMQWYHRLDAGKDPTPDPDLRNFYREFLGKEDAKGGTPSRVLFLANSGLKASMVSGPVMVSDSSNFAATVVPIEVPNGTTPRPVFRKTGTVGLPRVISPSFRPIVSLALSH